MRNAKCKMRAQLFCILHFDFCIDSFHMLALHYQLPPQPGHMRNDSAETAEVEELALAIGAVVVMHRHLGEAKAGVLELLDEFEADRAVGRLQVDHVEDLAAEQPEVAVDVA